MTLQQANPQVTAIIAPVFGQAGRNSLRVRFVTLTSGDNNVPSERKSVTMARKTYPRGRYQPRGLAIDLLASGEFEWDSRYGTLKLKPPTLYVPRPKRPAVGL